MDQRELEAELRRRCEQDRRWANETDRSEEGRAFFDGSANAHAIAADLVRDAAGWEKRSPAGEAYNRLVSAVRGFLADEDACAEEFAAETGELPAFAQEPFPRVLEMRSALVDIDNAALSTRHVGESAGVAEMQADLLVLVEVIRRNIKAPGTPDRVKLPSGEWLTGEGAESYIAMIKKIAGTLETLAARASQPSVGEVEG